MNNKWGVNRYTAPFIGGRKFNKPTAVAFQSLTANGTSGTETSTILSLGFDVDPVGLNSSNVSSDKFDTVSVAGSGLSRSVEITNLTAENAEEITVNLSGLTGYSFTPPSRTVTVYRAATVDDPYEPTARLATFNYAVDEDGWTPRIPEADSQFVYWSEDGNDETAVVYNYADGTFPDYFNPTGEMAFATHNAARAACYREGKSDFLCVRRGDTLVRTGLWQLSINGNTNRHYMTDYGNPALPRPIVDCQMYGNGNDYFIGQLRPNFAITNIEFTNSQRNPNSPNFVGWMDVQDNGFLFTFGAGSGPEGFLLEGCKVSWFQMGINFAGGLHGNTIIRRNVFHNFYGSGFTMGLNAVQIKMLEEENVFYKCGYYDIYEDTKQQNPYNGSVEKTLVTALTGEAEETVVMSSNIPLNTPFGTKLIIRCNDASEVLVPILSFTGATASIPPTDFTTTPAAAGNLLNIRVYGATQYHHSTYLQTNTDSIFRRSVSIRPSSMHYKQISAGEKDVVSGQNVSLYDNLAIAGEIFSSIGGNVRSEETARFENYDVSYNVAAHIGHDNNRGLSWGLDLIDHLNSRSINNIYALPGVLATNKYATALKGIQTNNDVRNNISYLQGRFGNSGVFPGQDYGLQRPLRETTPGVTLVSTAVGLDDFMETETVDEAIELFTAELLERQNGAWSTIDADYKAFVRAGLTPTVNTPIITSQPSNALVLMGQSAIFSVGVYSKTPVTYQWNQDGVPIPGAMDYKYETVLDVDNAGSEFTVTVTNAQGSVTSTAGVLTEQPPRLVPRLAGTDTIKTVSTITIPTGDSIRFTFKLVSISGIGGINLTLRSQTQQGVGLSSSTSKAVFTLSNGSVHEVQIPSINNQIYDGSFHVFEIPAVEVGQPIQLILDGEVYESTDTEGNPTVRGEGANFTFGGFGSQSTGTTSQHEVFNFEQLDSDGVPYLAFALDSGNATEAAVIGTGTWNINLATGAWVNLS